MKKALFLMIVPLSLLLAAGCGGEKKKDVTAAGQSGEKNSFYELKIPFSPRHYVCYRTPGLVRVDGFLDDREWGKALWTEYFCDIEGSLKPKPPYDTRVKMLWDDDYLYIAAELEEPDLWATLRQRDTIIFYDNDFEVFIDPDGDTHNYYEYEMNAFGTWWDLMLIKPYRDGGPPVNGWDIRGLKTAAKLYGTINRPGDRDDKWTLEIAMPWEILRECAPAQKPPAAGDMWRINFSRVEWDRGVIKGRYVVKKNAMGSRLPEHNWVWSPQGVINMHAPETWGFLLFSGKTAGEGKDIFERPAEEKVKWVLRNLYYKEKKYRERTGEYTSSLEELNVSPSVFDPFDVLPVIGVTEGMYEIILPDAGGTVWHINSEGRTWKTVVKEKH
jgi:hypothetical protein